MWLYDPTGDGSVDWFKITLAKGAVMASDAFFPFPDSIEVAAAAGVVAAVHPGGSIRDEESIRVADQHGIAMVFTKVRHFRH